jgi:hypothetical protein
MSFVNKEWHRLILPDLVFEWFAKGRLDERFPSVEAAKLLAKDTGGADKFRRIDRLDIKDSSALTARMLRSGFLKSCSKLSSLKSAVACKNDLMLLCKLGSLRMLDLVIEREISSFPEVSFFTFEALDSIAIIDRAAAPPSLQFLNCLVSSAPVLRHIDWQFSFFKKTPKFVEKACRELLSQFFEQLNFCRPGDPRAVVESCSVPGFQPSWLFRGETKVLGERTFPGSVELCPQTRFASLSYLGLRAYKGLVPGATSLP